MISPNNTGNPAPIDKDVISGADEHAGSAPFLSSLLSLISSLNPINTLGVQDETVNSSSEISYSPPDLIDRKISLVSVQGETTFSEKPGSLSLNPYPSANDKQFGKSDASTLMLHKFGGWHASKTFIMRLDIKRDSLIKIEKGTVEFSSNIVQPDHSEEKAVRTTALMGKDTSLPFKDMSVSRQEVKGLNVDENRESVIFEEVNRDLTGFHVSKENGEPDFHNSLKTFKDGFEGEFKITMAEVSTDHRDKNGVHQQRDVPDPSLTLRQIDLPSKIVSADNTKPLQDKQSPEFSKAIIAHLDMEHSHNTDLSTIKVTVEHDRLGELDIKLIFDKGVINGQIKTPEVTTADLIVRNIPEIINSLVKDGLNVGNLFVSLRNSKSGRDNFDRGNSGDSGEISRRQTNNLYLTPSSSGYINIFV